MSADLEKTGSHDDEPPLSPINLDSLSDTIQSDETPIPAIPEYHGQSSVGGQQAIAMANQSDAPKRPVGVTVIAVLNFIGAVLFFAGFVFAMFEGGQEGFQLYILPFQVVLTIVMGIGLLMLKRWGYIVTLIGYGLNIAVDLVALFSESITSNVYINLAISIVIIWYLARSEVSENFR